MALPFYVRCETFSPRFYEVSSGRFQQLDRGVIPPFVPGFQFLLVVNELADFLRTLGLEGVRFEDATLYDPRTAAEVRTHTCLRVHKSLDADIRVLHPDGVFQPFAFSIGEVPALASGAVIALAAKGYPTLFLGRVWCFECASAAPVCRWCAAAQLHR